MTVDIRYSVMILFVSIRLTCVRSRTPAANTQ